MKNWMIGTLLAIFLLSGMVSLMTSPTVQNIVWSYRYPAIEEDHGSPDRSEEFATP